MVDFSALTSCADLTVEQAAQAASSPRDLAALLTRVAEIARPEDGCPKILMALGRAATERWLEGELRVELSGDDATTTLAILYDHGFGVRERMLPLVRLAVPLDEFYRAIRIAPKLLAPLIPTHRDDGSVVLTTEPSAALSEPPSIRIHDASLDGRADTRTTAPPHASTSRTESVVEKLETLNAEPDVRIAANGAQPTPAGADVHTHPTRRIAVIDPEMIRAATARRDPRRDDED